MSLSSKFILPTLLATSLQVQALPYQDLSNTAKSKKPTPEEICRFIGINLAENIIKANREKFKNHPGLEQISMTIERVNSLGIYRLQGMEYHKGESPIIRQEEYRKSPLSPIQKMNVTFNVDSILKLITNC